MEEQFSQIIAALGEDITREGLVKPLNAQRKPFSISPAVINKIFLTFSTMPFSNLNLTRW